MLGILVRQRFTHHSANESDEWLNGLERDGLRRDSHLIDEIQTRSKHSYALRLVLGNVTRVQEEITEYDRQIKAAVVIQCELFADGGGEKA